MAARASGSQWGAPSPANAGTRYTPPVEESPAAIPSVCAAEAMTFKPSRSHCTAAPATKIEPSSA